MQTSYIYSASKVNTLSQFLLNKTDVERLLVAEPGEDLQSALKETYLAPYILHTPDENVPLAIEQTLQSAKKLIFRITPQGEMFRVLWAQYDVHNLRVFAKASVAGFSYEQCLPFVSERGIYASSYLYEHAQNNTLNRLQIGWQDAYSQAMQVAGSGDLQPLDGIFDALYFATSKRLIESTGDAFMRTYLKTLIDLYNLKSKLRHLQHSSISFNPNFIEGGTFGPDRIETLDQTIALFTRFGGEAYWESAIKLYQETGNSTEIDARSADYLLIIAREGSYDMFSSASLVLYYLKCRQSAANIRTIVVGKNSGLSADDIRNNLRLAYVND